LRKDGRSVLRPDIVALAIAGGRVVQPEEPPLEQILVAEDGRIEQVTIELCDGRPSDVEREGTQFGGGRFCPWTARVVDIDE
jgi:hypothetical protein